jgi:hypothetical protein
MPKFNKILERASSIELVQSCLSLTACAVLGCSAIEPVQEVVDFVALLGYGVSEFSVTGIDATIDPANPLAFPIKLESNRDKFSFKMRAIDSAEAVPEPSEIAGIVTAAAMFVGLFFKRKGKRKLELGKTGER